jgi:hypothetical protein
MLLQFFDCGFVLRKRGQVLPLVQVVGVVIQLFPAIRISDVATALRLDGVVVEAVGHQDRAIPFLAWIFQKGFETLAVQPIPFRQAT